jgi:hypothetical protein
VVAVKVHLVFFAAALSKRAVMVPEERGKRPSKGLPKEVASLGVVGLLLQSVHLNAKSQMVLRHQRVFQ